MLNKRLESIGTAATALPTTIRLANDSWTLLHDTVVEVMESWRSWISMESKHIQQMLNTHAVQMAASFGRAPLDDPGELS